MQVKGLPLSSYGIPAPGLARPFFESYHQYFPVTRKTMVAVMVLGVTIVLQDWKYDGRNRQKIENGLEGVR
ncbi:hypothetical protein L0P88_11775 [Muricauda sp. SCSIO 64092]|uniref:hypothetical protein n=1 Tax=Allomuricauda sp. SCSIO 64092 TaxID=2908842 RepID=UPI001FF49F64|nr:hypothetical protein [Muricauda sp. SCSIO 64092]UOY09190.1 hypothetical protein L0P88_11775 [Muricauda sp. SCSIO 64092]